MATLPTNYADAVWVGNRKYTMTENQDNSVSFTDVTEYSVDGSYFGAGDINRTNTQINGMANAKVISIASSAWSSSAVTVNGNDYFTTTVTGLIIFEDNPQIAISPTGTVPTTAEENAFALLAYAVADVSSGSITFYAYSKPSTTITLMAKGVA